MRKSLNVLQYVAKDNRFSMNQKFAGPLAQGVLENELSDSGFEFLVTSDSFAT